MAALASLWLLLACASGDADTGPLDRDADGHAEGADCDDADPRRAPGLEEECDRLDNDCDELVDEADPDLTDGATWFTDADGDGVGDGLSPVTACARGDGYVGSAGDCDDTDPTVSTSTPWYADEDGDGYGDAASSLTACGAPVGHVADATDCDDADGGVNPGEFEICGDGVDQDCDGTPNACGPGGDATLPDGAWLVEGDDASALGQSLAALGAPGGAATFAAGAPDADDGAGEVSVWAWADERFERVARLGGAEEARAGLILGAGDLDADGAVDLLVAGGAGAGAWLLRGPFDADRDLAEADASVGPFESGEVGGLAFVGDHDGDGLAELLVGVTGATGTAGYVIGGTATGTVDLAAPVATLAGGRVLGATAAGLGDTDGDGVDDLAFTNFSGSVTLTSQGVVYVLPGPLSGEIALPEVTTLLAGEQAYGGTGMVVDAPGDVDGDGYADVLVGGPSVDEGGSDAGAAWLVRGPVGGTVELGAADWILRGATAGEALGRSVAAADVNGDGRLDLVAGGAAGGVDRGEAVVWFSPGGEARSDEADARFHGAADGDGAGAAVIGLGDADGDGDAEVLVGAPGADTVYTIRGGLGL